MLLLVSHTYACVKKNYLINWVFSDLRDACLLECYQWILVYVYAIMRFCFALHTTGWIDYDGFFFIGEILWNILQKRLCIGRLCLWVIYGFFFSRINQNKFLDYLNLNMIMNGIKLVPFLQIHASLSFSCIEIFFN